MQPSPEIQVKAGGSYDFVRGQLTRVESSGMSDSAPNGVSSGQECAISTRAACAGRHRDHAGSALPGGGFDLPACVETGVAGVQAESLPRYASRVRPGGGRNTTLTVSLLQEKAEAA